MSNDLDLMIDELKHKSSEESLLSFVEDDRSKIQKEYEMMCSYCENVREAARVALSQGYNPYLWDRLKLAVAERANRKLPKSLNFPEYKVLKVDWDRTKMACQLMLVRAWKESQEVEHRTQETRPMLELSSTV